MGIIEAQNLKKYYRINVEEYVPAIKGIDAINIAEGEFVCIMGPSGSGKSTLLNILTTIDAPTKGEVKINDASIYLLSETTLSKLRYAYFGFIFQELNILMELSIYDNIAIPLIMARIPKTAIQERIEKVADEVGIVDILHKMPSECSGGQLQRVAVARAMITNPKIIVADEPTGNLDAKTSDKILTLFKGLHQNKKTILLVTHDCYVASYASRVLYLKDGRIECELIKEKQSQKTFFDQIVKLNASELEG